MLTRTPHYEVGQTREPPHNIEAEQALLGAILVHNAVIEKVEDFLRADHFFDPLHGQIYETAAKMIQAGKQATPITLKTFFEAAEPIIEDLTVPQYLGRLAANATTIINAEDYGRTIYDLAVRRQLIVLGEDMINSAYDAPIDFPPESQIQEAEARLGQLARTGTDDQIAAFSVALTESLDVAFAAYERGGGLAGLPTGIKDLDQKMGGMVAGDLIIIAGRPSMGKTALATTIAWNVAKTSMPVDFYSLEMSRQQLADRILAAVSGMPSEKIRRGQVSESELRKVVDVANHIKATPLTIDHRGGLSIDHLRARARRLQRRTGARLIVVDYLQLMHSALYRGKSRVQEITEITTGLKALAKELDVPIIALSQLSRDLEKRDDKRPLLSDLRDSGSIEQDADVVLFCYRDEYYVERRKPPEHMTDKFSAWQTEMLAAAGKAEIIIGKQRMGPVGTVQVAFESELARFSDLARSYQLPEGFA